MSNKGLLIVIVVLLVGIVAFLAIDMNRKKDSSISGSIGEVVEEIGDEIDDHTTSR